MITFTNVIKKYGPNIVLNIEDLSFKTNEIVGIVGNNGAGKTTMFSAILDLVRLSGGIIENNQIPVHNTEDWKEFTSSYLDEKFLIGYLTPYEYLEMVGKLKHYTPEEIHDFITSYSDFLNGEFEDNKKYIRSLSKGNQQKVGILAALIGKPQVILLDEPFSNLDPTSQYRLRDIIKDFAEKNNTTFLISSHDLNHVAELCTRIVILEKGKVVDDVINSSNETMQKLVAYFAV